MSGNTNYIDQVGAFLDNELSGEDLVNFNKELASNPELVNELNHQNELIEGIKDFRVTELKARLNNIPVSTGVWYGTAVKIISGALITAGIGYGIFELSQVSNENIPEQDQEELVATDQDQSDEPQVLIKTDTDRKQNKTPDTDEVTQENIQKEAINNKKRPVAVPSAPKVLTPESFDTDQPIEDDLDIPESSLGSENEPLESQLEIEIISNKRKYPFHYQVNEGRLLLYGDFDEEPYELLEININDEKKLFLFFKNKYYEIEKTAGDITPLQQITNRSLITQLEKLKNKDS